MINWLAIVLTEVIEFAAGIGVGMMIERNHNRTAAGLLRRIAANPDYCRPADTPAKLVWNACTLAKATNRPPHLYLNDALRVQTITAAAIPH